MSRAIRSILKIRRTVYLGGAVFVVAIALWAFAALNGNTEAIVQKDGIIMYGASANTTPQVRDYTSATNSFGSAAGSVAGTQAQGLVLKTSPIKNEAIAGYVNSSGVLQVMCFNGTTWTNEWTVTVGGTGTTRPFDVAYEKNSGKAMVLYGNNGANLGYRTKPSASACGSANWASASTFTPARTTGTVSWVRLAQDTRASSNLLAAAWADGASDLSSQVWSGSAWGNEPTSALSIDLEFATASQDIDSFDIGYESTSGDIMVVFGAFGTGTTNLIKYAACTGGTSACTWAAVANVPTVADAATSIDLGVNPLTDQMGLVAVDNGGGADSCDMSTAVWSGTAWTGVANVDATVECPTAGQRTATTFWLTNGAATRRVVAFDDATGTTLQWLTYNANTVTAQTAITVTPTINDVRARYTNAVNPFDRSEAMVTIVDSTGMLSVKRLVMDSSGVFTWTNANGASSLGTVSQAAVGDASFDYWNFIPVPTYTQSAYGWFTNANSVQPGSALASENTSYSTSAIGTPIRLRTQLTVADVALAASGQQFRLQYASSTGGPWNSMVTEAWWNSSWTARRKITVDNSASTETLTDFPLRVSLSSANIDYSKTKDAGEDIRFTDSSGNLLKHEIEKWDEAGTSEVWVKVPQLDIGSTTGFIFMYYGNSSASDGQDVTNTWGSNFKLVHHLNAAPANGVSGGYQDSTITNLDGTATAFAGNGTSNSDAAGKIARADIFASSVSNRIDINDDPALSFDVTGNYTWSAWVNPTAGSTWSTIWAQTLSSASDYFYFYDHMSTISDTNLPGNGATNTVTVWLNGASDSMITAKANDNSLTAGVYQLVTVTYDGSQASTSRFKVYVNGVDVTFGSKTVNGGAPANFDTSATMIGSNGMFGEPHVGSIDEVRFQTGTRSAEWVEADYRATNNNMNGFGAEEIYSSGTSGGHGFYDNSSATNGAAITGTLLTGSNVLASYQEQHFTVPNPNAIAVGNKAEWDFSFDLSAMAPGTYYYRMAKNDGTALTTYSVYPTLTITSSGPTLDQQLRGGQSVLNGVKQPFGF